MKTNIEITFSALNSHYLMSNNRINTEYLCDAVVMWAMNTERLYNELVKSGRKITSVVWEAFADLANDHIKMEERGYSCSGYQLKKWLNEYGNGYDTLAQVVQELTSERRALQE
jgi:hypothetical protein